MRKLILLIAIAVVFGNCGDSNQSTENNAEVSAAVKDAEFLHRSIKQITDVIIHDIFSPPVASRIYAYSSIAAYEVMAQEEGAQYKSLAGQLTDFTAVPKPEKDNYIAEISSTIACLTVGKALIFSEEKINEFKNTLLEEYKKLGVSKTQMESSIAYGEAAAQHILAWADKDNYKQTRTFPKFTVNSDEQGRWKPTPPDYMEGIEPHWNKIRPFVLDSAAQFVPVPPTPFSLKKSSKFWKELMEVYEVGKNLTEEQQAIAQFWDCNPYVSVHIGHVMYAKKKITPGGHWINIAAIAARKTNADFSKTAQTYALTGLALADGFISCWDEKYRSNLVRPETLINEEIDENWLPLLQTPPFPEYTSGHSVISAAAATALTSLYGEDFKFDDDSEVEYGLPVRSFDSFFDASEEAAVSRLYGGIHYRPACVDGVVQGKNVGKFVVENISF